MWAALAIVTAGQLVLGQVDPNAGDQTKTVIVPLDPAPQPQPPAQPVPVQQPVPQPMPQPVQPIPVAQPYDAGVPSPAAYVPPDSSALPPPVNPPADQSKSTPPAYVPPSNPYAPPDAGVSDGASRLVLRGALESDLGLFPSGFGVNGFDLTAAIHPVIAFGVGDDFLIELGPTFRFRLADFAPDNRSTDIGGFLRGPDWDEPSDFGQVVQTLRIGHDQGPFRILVGPVRKKTLGLGHVLWRYSNQLNPNYHPAGGELDVRLGPVHGQFFASDVLGARLFGGEIAWDIGGTFTSDPDIKDRYGLALELVHDQNLAGRPFRPNMDDPVIALPLSTILHLDATAVIVRNASLRWMLLAGIGTRANNRGDLGLVVGMTLDATLSDLGFSTRIELRKQAGGFRQGFFGPMYELQRFVDVGFHGPGLGDAQLPDTGSAFGELKIGLGSKITIDAAAEYFFFQRLDLDGSLSFALLNDWFYGLSHVSVLGIGPAPRFAVTAGFRLRVLPSLYLTTEGGTLFFPQADGSLLRGITGSVGVGFDFEKK